MGANWRILCITCLVLALLQPAAAQTAFSQAGQPAPLSADLDWPQAGHDAQRSNATTLQVDPPYCYAWKWYEAPFASRVQPVVSAGRLFIGSMEGTLFARSASTGAPLWQYETGSPIRSSAAIYNGSAVIFTTHAGITYSLSASSGSLLWQTNTGSSSTAPAVDPSAGRVYVAASTGKVTALNAQTGALIWEYQSDAPVLTSPALSLDGQVLFAGNEAMQAFALNTATGLRIWSSALQGQSLADRYPVVSGDMVFYRSQPLDFFHQLLQEGDATMAAAGAWSSTFNTAAWTADWAKVRPLIQTYLAGQPTKQTFFALRAADGVSRGTAPVLYTYGNNDIPAVPVVSGANIYLVYRARHGIQTDSGSVHVSSQYDAELGRLDPATLDIVPLTSSQPLSGSPEFRMTSDEPAMITLGGSILWVDNWERLGGLNLQTGQLALGGSVSNDWPECFVQCGPATSAPFFPMNGVGAAYPFPSPRVTEGHQRGGAVIANNMVYWRVIEGGLAALAHQSGSACPAPQVWGPGSPPDAPAPVNASPRPLVDYLALDLTQPRANPPAALVERLRAEVSTLVSANQHWMPYYLERGFSNLAVWPYNTGKTERPPSIGYNAHGNVYSHDPGDLLTGLAMAYPYLDSTLQAQVKSYMSAEMGRFPPYDGLPYGGSGEQDWLHQGQARELYSVPFRAQLNNWPPVDASLNALYGLWLWSKNTGDWSYAQSHWSSIRTLYLARTPVDHTAGKMDYAADLGGVIGFYRMAVALNQTADAAAAQQVALAAMADLRDHFDQYAQRADAEYLDPRDQPTGWYAPALFGLTPEVGLLLREQTAGAAVDYLYSKEYGTGGDGLRWWYLTRAGSHAEQGETSYVAPNAAWSHFLAHAFLIGDQREVLTAWLDRPWGKADVFSIQKIAATLQAAPLAVDLSSSKKTANPAVQSTGGWVQFQVVVSNSGFALSDPVQVTDTLPAELTLIPGSASVTTNLGSLVATGQTVTWDGVLPASGTVTIHYQAQVALPAGQVKKVINTAQISAPGLPTIQRSAEVLANGRALYLPSLRK